MPSPKIGPAIPSRFALHEASWSGTPCSAGYEWFQRASKLALLPGSPPPQIDALDRETAGPIGSYESSLGFGLQILAGPADQGPHGISAGKTAGVVSLAHSQVLL